MLEGEPMKETFDKLLPCPFCGGSRASEQAVSNTNGNRRFIACHDCMADGPWSDKSIPATAAQQWNRRALPTRGQAGEGKAK